MTGPAAVAAAAAVWLLWSRPLVSSRQASLGPAAVVVLCLVVAVVAPRSWSAPVVVLALAAGAGRLLWRRRTGARAAEANAARMAEVCDVLAAELVAGRTTESALDEATLVWPAVRPVADACRLGGDVPAAFREVARTPGAGRLDLLAAAWSVSQRTGGGLAAATRRVADAVRCEQATRRVVSGELASARATARLVAALPLLALAMGSGAGADPWSFLLGTPLGLGCLAAGLAIGFAGLWWIELIAGEVEQ